MNQSYLRHIQKLPLLVVGCDVVKVGSIGTSEIGGGVGWVGSIGWNVGKVGKVESNVGGVDWEGSIGCNVGSVGNVCNVGSIDVCAALVGSINSIVGSVANVAELSLVWCDEFVAKNYNIL